MKRKIVGSEFADTDLKYNICSHLKEILEVLESNGAKWDKTKPLVTDKGGAHTLKLNNKLDLQLIAHTFEIPSHIELSNEYKSVICRRCWCDIEGK